ncbi:NADH-quinone oxidoreductase subunit NuoE [Blochmannia endosymbiont of Polyrhachis (Hedomyrma) turneri]|uniref:NADH-quinone oxidoreductase subunit NuoE n=1 Tax=Blochmannia endosymbiont of Polyrhachis (Hedomyrma) turneri TaxID=1505596 RepID=UPI00061A6440|nr:NADH-quinone oxidoreductase subunit NuoE [Blochmannia endosymbiont of Polyrhachis (Hedomyrma) turneri]AKC60052.1 NADH-quinone oxidoreductase subunit E [Blochmannia endosymbiont of Polyrhachis (Hedomyrma) turneri]
MNEKNDKLNGCITLPVSVVSGCLDNDFSFTKEECQEIQTEITHYENLQAAVITSLKIVQKRCGWVMDCAIISIAEMLRISVSDVESVATFYNQIFRQPVGRHIIRFCDSVVCYISGCQSFQIKLEQFLCIKTGETTLDNRFTMIPVSCLGKCDCAPVIMIDDDIYTHVLSMDITEMLEKYL